MTAAAKNLLDTLTTRLHLRLPSPSELGWSPSNSLKSDELTPFQEGRSWEDWAAYVKKHYPVRYFLLETIPDLVSPVRHRWLDFKYWVKCHTMRRHRYHLLDLRGVDPLRSYTHGYLDPCEVMLLSGWAALKLWVEREEPVDPLETHGEEAADDPIIQQHKAMYDEAMTLYHYWTVTRPAEAAENERIYREMKTLQAEARRRNDKEGYDAAAEKWLSHTRDSEEQAESMWLRLAKIRPYLWT